MNSRTSCLKDQPVHPKKGNAGCIDFVGPVVKGGDKVSAGTKQAGDFREEQATVEAGSITEIAEITWKDSFANLVCMKSDTSYRTASAYGISLILGFKSIPVRLP